MSTTPILSIENVSKFYTNKTALNKVSMTVPKGEIYGLLGPNGAGKTTLIRILNQITQPEEGKVLFYNEPLSNKHIKSIGYLPEERGLYKKIKVQTQLEYFAKLRGLNQKEAKSRAEFWLNEMGLFDIRKKKIEELSKGMQQKIQFIVAVINEPELIILDEPFSGFDPVNAELLTQKILDLKKNGSTILYSTHRMESVEKLCDSMALIHQSEKILDGTLSEIKNKFKKDQFSLCTKGYYTPSNSEFKVLNQSVDEIGNINYEIAIGNRNNNELLTDVCQQTEIISFNQYIPSINEIFIQLVTK
jgi:ABC-2 type transport system ATP-binding protein